jgi:transglycosylase-like protein with SLT domain
MRMPTALTLAALAAAAGGVGSSASAAGQPRFGARVDNPWFPLRPGTTYVYRGVKDGQPSRDVVTVTQRTRAIAGARCRAVRDRLYLRGRLEERTTDWYAQDRRGNVWYFGEATAELDRRGHVTSREGSWLAGRNGARAGIYMPAHPRVGQSGRQEFYEGHAEDHFQVLSLRASVRVPYTSSKRALLTKEWTPLEPGVVDHKLYVRGIGTVLEQTVKGGSERNELVSVTPSAPSRALLASAPGPGAPLPHEPAQVAAALTGTTSELLGAVARWGGRGGPPRDVTLLALYQQRLERLLARDAALGRAVLPRVGGGIRDEVLALGGLRRLARPQPLRRFRVGRAAPASTLRRYYAEAERRFGVGWSVLAAVNYVESAFGKLRSASSAGAVGPMQFMPATWRAYGLGGDVREPRDAVLGAANYLRANGAPRRLRRALYAYNRSSAYVDAVVRYSRRIRRDPRTFLVYYARQVFVVTPGGDRRLTGPRG